MSLCKTPTNEAYIYFFNNSPKHFTGNFAEKLLNYQPVDSNDHSSIHVAYDYARTLELSFNISGELIENTWKGTSTPINKYSKRKNNSSETNAPSSQEKDPNAISSGPAKQEQYMYKKHDRCFKCGIKGWSDINNPCRKEKSTKEESTVPKNE